MKKHREIIEVITDDLIDKKIIDIDTNGSLGLVFLRFFNSNNKVFRIVPIGRTNDSKKKLRENLSLTVQEMILSRPYNYNLGELKKYLNHQKILLKNI